MTDNNALDVVVVTYASRDLIQPCLDSLYEFAPHGPMRVFVVDNASPDDTTDVVAERFPAATLIARDTNGGFAVANNVALGQVAAPYVLILNPDARLEPGTLDHLLAVMEVEPTIGMIGCRLLTATGKLDNASKRAFPSPMMALTYFASKAIGRSATGYVRLDIADDAFADVDAVNGAFMLIRKTALDEVGLLDEKYWMYGEDLDWCARFAKAGWRVVYDGRVVAHHIKAGSTGGRRPTKLNYHFHRSMVLFYRDHISRGNRIADFLVTLGVWMRFLSTSALSALQSKLSARKEQPLPPPAVLANST